MPEPIEIRPEDAIPPPKANFRYLVDAVNNLLNDGVATRTLITAENNAIKDKLDKLDLELKKLVFHLETMTGEKIKGRELE